MEKFNFLFTIGDIHGDLNIIPLIIKEHNLHNTCFIIVGDCGWGFDNKKKELNRIKYLTNRLSISDSYVYCMRGNHDNPNYFTGEFDTDRVKMIPDYTTLNINNHNILLLGGAISKDRYTRKSYYKHLKGIDVNLTDSGGWWPNEGFIFNEEKLKTVRDIDIVISHNSPNTCYPFSEIPFSEIDKKIYYHEIQKLKTDISIERHQLTQAYELLYKNNKISSWFYGHHHKSYKTYINDTKFMCLNINEFNEIL